MITIDPKLKEGDRVYAWFSGFPMKASKKPDEHEFTLGPSYSNGSIVLISDSGYKVIYTKELVDTWFGNVRKA